MTSGGVSVGEADYTRDILQEIGQVDFWKLAIKPGKPLAFGRLPNSIFFGLPGNPVSAAVTSKHRKNAFEACEFIMDYLKTNAPLWKQESTCSGMKWVKSNQSDEAAIASWYGKNRDDKDSSQSA